MNARNWPSCAAEPKEERPLNASSPALPRAALLDLSGVLAHNQPMWCNGISTRALFTVTLALLGACGREPLDTYTASAGLPASGGATEVSTGGAAGKASGGAPGTATSGSGGHTSGGVAGASTGGAAGFTYLAGGAAGATTGGAGGGTRASGGAAGATTGGTGGGTRASGGAAGATTGGAGGGTHSSGGAIASGGSGGSLSCKGVVCAPIPSTCKKLVQEPGACCPTCTDTGCNSCPTLTCQPGMVAEILAGDCCPTCVPDSASLCAAGLKSYTVLRQQMLDKYGSVGCKNSSDCTLVVESNACAYVCNVALPIATASDFTPNLSGSAATYCANCSPPAPVVCDPMAPACVNGKCVAVSAP
jgi:hypothetical protein